MKFLNHLFIKKLIKRDDFLRISESNDIFEELFLYFSEIDELSTLKDEIIKFTHIRYLNLKEEPFKKEILNTFDNNLTQKFKIYPLEQDNEHIKLVTFQPLTTTLDILQDEFETLNVELYFAFEKEVEEGIETVLKAAERKLEKSENNNVDYFSNTSDEKFVIKSEDVSKKVDEIINKGIDLESSDIHIEPIGENYIRVRYRVDGDLVVQSNFFIHPKEYPNIIARLKVMADMDSAEKRKPQDGKISGIQNGDFIYDLRVSSMCTIFGEKIVIRIIKKMVGTKDLSVLGFTDLERKRVNKLVQKHNGIVLITGETGSGKSTTMYTLVNLLNNDNVNICTVEDPVESEIPGIFQVQVNESAGITFANTLKTLLRQDPDIMLVGEIRDLETAEIAIKSANTGHFVLSTIHTNNSTATINRLISMGIENYKISEGIVGIISQRLVKKLCPYCRQEYTLSDEEEERFKKIMDAHALGEVNSFKFYKNNNLGCSHCNKGTKGRLVVAEILNFNDDINNLIASDITSVELRKKILYNHDYFLPFEYTVFFKSELIPIDVLKTFLPN